MNSRDGHTSPPAPRIKEQNDVRLTAAKTRVNDRHAIATRLDRIGADLEAIHRNAATLAATSTRLAEQLNSGFEKIIREAIQAALKGTEVRYSSNHTPGRDDEEPRKDDEEPREDASAEEVVLDQTMVRDVEEHGEEPMAEEVALDQMTKVRCVDEPGEDALSLTDEEAPAAAVILAQVEAHVEAQEGAQVEARDDRDSGEDGQPMTTDPSNFDETDSESEDGTVPMIVTPPKLPPAPDPIPSTAFKIAVNTVSGHKSDQDHKPESTPTNASDQPSATYDKEWLQTSPPPDPSVPTPKRDSRNRQSTGYQNPAAHIHVQVYGYPPAHNGHGGYHSNTPTCIWTLTPRMVTVTMARMLPMEAITTMDTIPTNTSTPVATIIANVTLSFFRVRGGVRVQSDPFGSACTLHIVSTYQIPIQNTELPIMLLYPVVPTATLLGSKPSAYE
ncbi:hypothetical protein THAOC_22100 [Thalassiosira oceanica]|uniref:Uncharacterized protein n=1 Tax=Thalassiosira oceanica TaxID=159749 RepID=K0RZC1_THAOC|nr:hypothetical protein THAOC_22100 [Thalassiosira oceanica]|eukprot:EJK57819.1 hypothetical protein THAOC_22100 [Thalassiosira oceanica]